MSARPVVPALCLAAAALLTQAIPALGSWSQAAGGSGAAKARVMPSGNQPTASASNHDVTVSWTQNSFPGGSGVDGYLVKRYSTGGIAQTIGTGCTGTVSALTCTESSVPAGSWRYTITPKQGSWTGAESAQSTTVTIAPSLALGPPTSTSLPSTLSGSIGSFLSGQTVSFRLDDPQTGQALTGSISPSPVQSGGSATVSVTIPAGTSNGSHTVYAVGSGGDIASAAITVAVPRFVRNIGQASCGATRLTVTVPAAGVAANDTLILRLMLRGTTTAAVTGSDSKGNTYTIDRDVFNGNQRIVVLRARATTALVSGNTISVTYPSSSSAGLVADEFSGIAPSPLDTSGQGTGNSATPSASATTTSAPEVVVGAVSIAGLQPTPLQPSAWTALTNQSLTCTSAAANIGGYRIVSSTGTNTYNPTGLVSGRWSDAIVAYRAG